MKRLLYRLLVNLHPPSFRARFGSEMVWIFDQKKGSRELWADLGTSLLRQWLLRSPLWIVPLAILGGFCVMLLTSWTGTLTRRALSAASSSPQAFILLMTAGSMCAIILTLISAVAFFQLSRRRRHA